MLPLHQTGCVLGMQDSNLRPLAPKASAIPDYANSHYVIRAGFEPELIAPKTIVLPLHHRTISNFVITISRCANTLNFQACSGLVTV